MSPRLLWGALAVLATAVGLFHGWIKADLDRQQVEQIQELMFQPELWQGRYPPEFELPLLDGGSFVLSENIGRKTIALNFFTTWCGPCREEMPELDRFYGQSRDEEFVLLGIDVGEERELVETFVDQLALSFPVALDRQSSVAGDFQVTSFPTTVVIGLDGTVQLYEIGAIRNAEIAFGELMTKNRSIREEDGAISAEGYRTAYAAQPPLAGGDDDGPELEGRALEIAEAMPCPCGCEQQVEECTCQTADRITERLATMDLGDRTDREVMEELNREFCVGAGG